MHHSIANRLILTQRSDKDDPIASSSIRREESGVGSNESFGEEEEEAAAQSLKAPRRESFSASTNRTCHLRRRRPEAESQHQQIFMPEMDLDMTGRQGPSHSAERHRRGDQEKGKGRCEV
ncbi:hypothetical protein Bca4012_043199 [Brassica carinata]